MGADDNNRSNQLLPFGKVRMGLRLGWADVEGRATTAMTDVFQKKGFHKHSQIHGNPRFNPKLKRSKIIRDD